MADLSSLDSEVTAAYKEAQRLRIPLRYTYVTDDGKRRPITAWVLEQMQSQNPRQIYERLQGIKVYLTRDAFIDMWMTIAQSQGVEIPVIAEAATNFLELKTPLIEVEVKRRAADWLSRINRQVAQEAQAVSMIVEQQRILQAAAPTPIKDLKILTATWKWHPEWKSERDRRITREDGLEIFNLMIPSIDAPAIIYYEDGGYSRLYEGETAASMTGVGAVAAIPDFTRLQEAITTLRTSTNISTDRHVFYFFLARPEGRGYQQAEYHLDDNTVSLRCDIEEQKELARKLATVMPFFRMGEPAITQIHGEFHLPPMVVEPFVFLTLLLNEPVFGQYLYTEERNKAQAEKKRLVLAARSLEEALGFGEISTGEAPITLLFSVPTSESLPVIIRQAQSEAELRHFLEIFSRLMTLYQQKAPAILAELRAMVPESKPIELKVVEVTPEPGTALRIFKSKHKNLQALAPELFVKGYTRDVCQCPNQPVPILSDEIAEWQHHTFIDQSGIQRYRTVMPFPPPRPDGKDQKTWYFACPNDSIPYPTVNVNKTENKGEYPYLPCCQETEHLGPGSRYASYYDRDQPVERKRGGYRFSTMKVLPTGGEGTIPEALSTLLQSGVGDAPEDFIRVGVPNTPNSLLHCVLLALENKEYLAVPAGGRGEESHRERVAQKYRREIARQTSPLLYRQELYDIPNAEITRRLNDQKIFLDPYLFYRGVEEIFKVNIFVFNPLDAMNPLPGQSEEKEGPFLEIPRSRMYSLRNPRPERPVVIILKHRGQENYTGPWPQCELVISRGRITAAASRPSGYGTAPTVMGPEIRVFDQRTFESIYNFMKASYQIVVFDFPWNTRRETYGMDVQARLDPFNPLQWDLILGQIPQITLTGQQVDSYGKTRVLVASVNTSDGKHSLSIFVPPSQPFNLPHVSEVPIVDERIARLLFGTPSGVTRGGFWYRVADYRWGFFVPVAHTTEIKGRDVPPAPIGKTLGFDLESRLRYIRTIQRYASFLMQLITWLYHLDLAATVESGGLPADPNLHFRIWWQEWVIRDEKMSSALIPPRQLPYRLPPVQSTQGGLNAIAGWWPPYFTGSPTEKKIHLYPRLHDKAYAYMQRFITTTEGLHLAPIRRLSGYFERESDFSTPPHSLTFTRLEHLSNYLYTRITEGGLTVGDSGGIVLLRTTFDLGLRMQIDPLFYRDTESGKIYLIQNVLDGDILRVVTVLTTWWQRGFNPGFRAPPTSAVEASTIPRVIYAISVKRQIIPIADETGGTTPYYQILRYSAESYAAMLPLR